MFDGLPSTLLFNPLYAAETLETVCVYVTTWVVKVAFSAVEQDRESDTAFNMFAMVSTADDVGASSAIFRSDALRLTKSAQVETLVALFLIMVLLPDEPPASVLVLFFAAPRASTFLLACAAFALRVAAL